MSYNLVEIDPISGEHKLKKIAGLSKLNVWTGTQADYNARKNTIPNGSYVNITDDAESGNGIKDIYSTDEVKTNKVWIDGKPIYRKVVTDLNVTINSGSGWNNIHAESIVDTLVDIKPYTNNGIWYGSMVYQIANGYLQGYSTGLNTVIKGYILEYTKK